jgi:hypothetical protein
MRVAGPVNPSAAQMTANDLLLWMSGRHAGSWRQFRAGVEQLHVVDIAAASSSDGALSHQAPGLPLHQILRFNLERLAHAEFFFDESERWQVAPPVLAVCSRGEEFTAILCGARSLALLGLISSPIENARTSKAVSALCPDQIAWTSRSSTPLIRLADALNVPIQHDAPRATLSLLRPIRDTPLRAVELPIGDWQIHRFSARTLTWRTATLDDAARARIGLFRFIHEYQRRTLLVRKGSAVEVETQTGKHILLSERRRVVISFDPEQGILRLPASCRAPLLVERALILCSGRLPSYLPKDGGQLEYENISLEVASAAASILGQRIA